MFRSSTHRAHIVQSNGAVILGIIALNRLVQVFGFWPLNLFFNSIYIRIAEWCLAGLCSYNIYYINKGVIDPYFAGMHLTYSEYMFNFGPISTAFISWCKSMIFGILPLLKPITPPPPPPPPPPPTVVSAPEPEKKLTPSELFEKLTCNHDSSLYPEPEPDVKQPPVIISYFRYPGNKLYSSTAIIIEPFMNEPEPEPDNRLIPPPADLPKLIYTPCVEPRLRPKKYRPRLLWQLNPSEECIEDFRIVQLEQFQKYWSRFGDRCFRSSYDNLTTSLLQRIFIPLRDSIDAINSNLNPRFTLLDCTRETGVLEHLLPGLNEGSTFTLSEVMQFLIMDNRCTPQRNRYICERIKELASNRKMAAFRYTVKVPGMPSDTDIIMHMFKTYLALREPAAIPPFFDVEIDVFKFLLTYFFITPELEHWNIFKD